MATVEVGATTVGTSESPHAGGMPAQRAVARAPDGAVWAVFPDAAPGTLRCVRATDDGRTFEAVEQSEALNPVWNASIQLDDAGNLDLVYKAESLYRPGTDPGDEGYIFYRKGDQPSPGRVHWSIRVRLYDVPALDAPNAVALLEDGETKVHAVWSRGREWNAAYHTPLKIDPDREIWMETRERIAGPFGVTGHPTPCIDLDARNGLWVAVWAGEERGVRVNHSPDYDGRWLFDEGRDAGPGPALEGSLSGVVAGDDFVIAYGGEPGRLHCRTAAGADHSLDTGAGSPVVRSALGVDGGGRVHAYFQAEPRGELRHAALDPGSGSWSEIATVHDAPVQSFSCERRGGAGVCALLAAGSEPPHDVVVASR